MPTEAGEPDPMRVKDLFADACDMPLGERAEFLDCECANDLSLRAQVEALLNAHDMADAFMNSDAAAESPSRILGDVNDGGGQRIGRYTIHKLLGEGGFGSVYLAEQQEPVRRRVALKLIKPGMDTRQVIARFDAERQALAMMDHPNIARIYDAAATSTGRPYFVMELVEGLPITEHCDAHQLDVKQRLELLVPVCQAVHHAHQKGVIHRDLKPSNVLVTMVNGVATPKVIDFGIAKALTDRLTANSAALTELRQMIGTPQYMSPEQAQSASADADTRSDIYSLGVLMYELLTGVTPFDAGELRRAAVGEVHRILSEVDPPKPSTRLSSIGELKQVAADRQIEPARLNTLLRRELDWVVMKCLEKDRSRRYETAADLAADLGRYLSGEAVSAVAPSRIYRMRKYVRRHRWLLGTAAAIGVALVAGLTIALFGLRRATRERDAAVIARNDAIAARAAEAEAHEYEQQTDQFLQTMFESIDPTEAQGKQVLVTDILDGATRRLDSSRPASPNVEASLRFTFGRAYRTLGNIAVAKVQLERASELYQANPKIGTAALARVAAELGATYDDGGDAEKAESTLRRAADLSESAHGPDHSETITVETNLAELLIHRGKTDEAEKRLLDLMERCKRAAAHPDFDPHTTFEVISALGSLRDQQGDYGTTEKFIREAIDDARKHDGDDSPYVIGLSATLGDVLRETGKFDEALTVLRDSRSRSLRVLGPDHPNSLSIANNLGVLLQSIGQLDEAAAIFQDTIERRRRLLGDDSHFTLLARSNYGLVLQGQGKLDEAAVLFKDVGDRMTRVLGPDHVDTMVARGCFASLQVQKGDVATAEGVFRDLVPRAVKIFGEHSPAATSFEMRLGDALLQEQKWSDAEPVLKSAYDGATTMGVVKIQGGFSSAYGTCLVKLGRAKEGVPLLLAADEMIARMPSPRPVARLHLYAAIVEGYQQLNQPDEAARWQAKLDTLQATTQAVTTTQPTTQVAR